jgi:hypothetical protein
LLGLFDHPRALGWLIVPLLKEHSFLVDDIAKRLFILLSGIKIHDLTFVVGSRMTILVRCTPPGRAIFGKPLENLSHNPVLPTLMVDVEVCCFIENQSYMKNRFFVGLFYTGWIVISWA